MLINGYSIDETLNSKELAGFFLDESQKKEKRWAACFALALKGDDYSIAILLNGLSNKDWSVRRICLEALKSHKKAKYHVHQIVKCLEDSNEYVQRTACVTCGALGIKEAHDLVLKLVIESVEPKTQIEALRALSEIWIDQDFDPIVDFFKHTKNVALRKEAAWALRRNAKSSNWRQIVEQFLCIDADQIKLFACELVEEFGENQDIGLLQELVSHKNGHIRKKIQIIKEKFECGS